MKTLDTEVRARALACSGRGRQIRLAAGLSQVELAAMAGVSQAALCRWESGKRRPRPSQASRYGQVLLKLEAVLA